jgi:uncharacterized membrane-anchored protein YhcB (DUF1043 family)
MKGREMKLIILIVIVVTVLLGTLLMRAANTMQERQSAVFNEVMKEMK